jgi:hypothetical protein
MFNSLGLWAQYKLQDDSVLKKRKKIYFSGEKKMGLEVNNNCNVGNVYAAGTNATNTQNYTYLGVLQIDLGKLKAEYEQDPKKTLFHLACKLQQKQHSAMNPISRATLGV